MRRLFRNCPYESYRFECTECINYSNCLKKKRIRRAKRRRQRRRKIWARRILFMLIFLVIGMAFLYLSRCLEFREAKNIIQETEEVQTESQELLQEIEPVVRMISPDAAGEAYYYLLSEKDKIELAKLVYAEARGEIFEGQVAVAAVVLNRYYYGGPEFDKSSITAIIKQKNQFADTTGVTQEMLDEYPSCMEAVEAACKGWDPTRKVFKNGALFFYAPEYVSGYQAQIREGIEVLTIGNHNFHNDFNY